MYCKHTSICFIRYASEILQRKDTFVTHPRHTRRVQYNNMLRSALLMGVALLMVACTGETEALQEPTSTPFPTAPAVARERFTVQRGDVIEPLEFTGRWEPRDQVELSFEVNGTVRRVEVRRGDAITEGQLLVDLQIEELEEQLEDAEFNLQTAINNLQTEAEGDADTIRNAERQVFDAQLALQRHLASPPQGSVRSALQNIADAEDNLEAAEEAYLEAIGGNGQGGPGAVDSAYDALLQARQAIDDAEFAYRETVQGIGETIEGWERTRIDLVNNLTTAEVNLEEVQQNVLEGTSDNNLRDIQVTIDRLREDIARSTLASPIDGVVLEVNVQPGDTVQAFNTVIRVGIPEPREAIANLPIGDSQRLSIGLVGVCQVANQPDTAVQCIIRQIPSSAQDADQTTRVAASMADLASPGAIIEVTMPLQIQENVLFLPPEAINTFQNRTFVILDTPDGGRRVNVDVGLQTDDRVEIISGVNEGDVVLGN